MSNEDYFRGRAEAEGRPPATSPESSARAVHEALRHACLAWAAERRRDEPSGAR